MRYASIRSLDISNGANIGIALFVQGCDRKPHCKNCFNPDTWDFNGGKEWTEETKEQFIQLIDRPYIKRVSILGGEPLAGKNYLTIRNLLQDIKSRFPDKQIWLYSGYNFEHFSREQLRTILYVDVLLDGEYIDEQRDITLAYRGSKNQRVIDIQKSLAQNKIVLYCD